MSRSVGIDLRFIADLADARAKYEAFIKEVEGRPVKLTMTAVTPEKANAENVATLGSPGGVKAEGPSAASKLDQQQFAKTIGAQYGSPEWTRGNLGPLSPSAPASVTVQRPNYAAKFSSEEEVALQAIGSGLGVKRSQAEQLLYTVKTENPSLKTADELAPAMFSRQGAGSPLLSIPDEPAVPPIAPAGSLINPPPATPTETAGRRGRGPQPYGGRFGAFRVAAVGLAASREFAQIAQVNLDYNAQSIEDSITSGNNPVAQAASRARQVTSAQIASKATAEAVAGVPLAALGALIGSAFGPIGTAVGASFGLGTGKVIGGLGYSAIYGKQDAIARGNAERSAADAQVREQDRQRFNNIELANRSIGVYGYGKDISEINSAELKLQQEESDRRRDRPGTTASLEKVQDAERESLRLRSAALSRQLDVEGAAVAGGERTAKRLALDNQIKNLEGQYTYKDALSSFLGLNTENTEQNAVVTKAIKLAQDQKRATYLDQNTSLVQSRAQTAQGVFDLQRNTLGGLSAITGASYLAAANAPQENRQQLIEQATGRFVIGAEAIIRDNRENTFDLGQQRTGNRQQREGYTLEGQTTLINAERTKALREAGGTGNRVLDYVFGFTAKRNEINAGADDQIRFAQQDESRRIIGVQGRVSSAGFQLNDQPLDAQISGITTSYNQQRQGITNPTRLDELSKAETADKQLAQQRFAQQVRLTGIGLGYESYALDRSLARDPIGAQAASIAGAAITKANQLAYSGLNKEAEAEKRIGIKQLELTKQNYLDAFRGREIDLRSTAVTNPRDVTDPSSVFDEIAKQERNIKDAKLGSTGNEQADSPAMKEVRDLLKPLMGYIEKLATGQQ